MKTFFLILLSCLAVLTNAFCASVSILEQRFSQFIPHGLSSGTAYRSVRDHQGFVWISTRNGIDRYDGAEFRHYRLNGNVRRGLHDGMMIYIYLDDAGELWVYTERSIVYHYNPLTDTFEVALVFPEEDAVGSLQSMYVYGDELILGVSNGLMSYDMKNGKQRVVNLFTDREIRCIAPYADGCLLLGTNKGLAVYDPERHRGATMYDNLFVDVKSVCYNPADQTIWVGGNGQGLYYIDERNSGRITRVGNQQFLVHCLCRYDENEMLVATDGDGLQLAQRTESGCQLTLLASDNEDAVYPIHSSCVRDVMIENGRLWLSMHFGGVVRLQPASSTQELVNPVAKTPSDSYVFGASFDNKGRAWLAFNQAIGCYERDGSLQGLYLDHQSRFLTVEAMADGTVWCGGFNTGVYHFNPVTGEQEYFSSIRGSSSKDCVYAFLTDARGYLWVGGLDFGLTCIRQTPNRRIGDDPAQTLQFDHTSIRQVSDIDQLNDSVLVVATSDGVYLYNYYTQRQEHLFIVSDEAEWQGTNFFCSVAVRNGHELWLASDGAGLVVYDTRTQKTESFGLEHGLPSLELRGVELVNDSTLFVASELDGVFSFDCKRRSFEHVLYSGENNQFQQNSIAVSADGVVVAGCDKCAVILKADEAEPYEPNAMIHIDGHAIVDGRITLPTDAADLSLTFTTTDIYHQSEYHFLCRIDGLDKDWKPLNDQHHLEYHKVPSGHYTIHVMAVGAGGHTLERSVELVVEQDVMWMLGHAAVLLLLLGLLVALHFYRSRQRKAEARG